jgi:antitoxin component YwqK of YwqJK toxin-antitoxin module
VEDGRVMGVEKKFYAENGNLMEQSLVHHFAESNYKKKFFYDSRNVLIRKEIYRNSKKPEAVIYYLFKYY